MEYLGYAVVAAILVGIVVVVVKNNQKKKNRTYGKPSGGSGPGSKIR